MAVLEIGEGGEEDGEEHEQDDDARVTPPVLGTAPLQRHEEAGDGGDDEEGAEQVHARELLLEGESGLRVRNRIVEAVNSECDADDAQREIDAEAGAPAEGVDQDAADHGRGDEADGLAGSDCARHEGEFMEWEAVAEES